MQGLMAVVAIVLGSGAGTAGDPPALSVTNVQRVAVEADAVSEGDRLGAAGLAGGRLATVLRDEARRAGLEVVDRDAAQALLVGDVVCAGPDQGRVGCSMQLRLARLERDAGGRAIPTYLVWGGARSLYQAAGWSAMAARLPQLLPELSRELLAARGTTVTAPQAAAR